MVNFRFRKRIIKKIKVPQRKQIAPKWMVQQKKEPADASRVNRLRTQKIVEIMLCSLQPEIA